MNLVTYWRAKRGLSVVDLAKKAGMNTATVSRIENGHVKPRVNTLGKLATALDVDLETLLPMLDESGDEQETSAGNESSGQQLTQVA